MTSPSFPDKLSPFVSTSCRAALCHFDDIMHVSVLTITNDAEHLDYDTAHGVLYKLLIVTEKYSLYLCRQHQQYKT